MILCHIAHICSCYRLAFGTADRPMLCNLNRVLTVESTTAVNHQTQRNPHPYSQNYTPVIELEDAHVLIFHGSLGVGEALFAHNNQF